MAEKEGGHTIWQRLSPVKASRKAKPEGGPNCKPEMPFNSSPSSSSDAPGNSKKKAIGLPEWESPNKHGRANVARRGEILIRPFTVDDLNDVPPPRQHDGSPPAKERAGREAREDRTKRREESLPNFENMVITFERQDSLGDVTFDGSIAYDEEYQRHQRRLKRKELAARRRAEAGYTNRRSEGEHTAAKRSDGSRRPRKSGERKGSRRPGSSTYEHERSHRQPKSSRERPRRQTKREHPSREQNLRAHVSSHTAYKQKYGSTDGEFVKKSPTKSTSKDSLDANELLDMDEFYNEVTVTDGYLAEPSSHERWSRIEENETKRVQKGSQDISEVPLGSLYNNWKGESNNDNSDKPNLSNEEQRRTYPTHNASENVALQQQFDVLSNHSNSRQDIDNTNNTDTSFSHSDASYIFGTDISQASQDSQRLAEIEQEKEMLELAMKRSLEDYSSGSSLSGISLSNSLSSHESGGYTSADTGNNAVRRMQRYPVPPPRSYSRVDYNSQTPQPYNLGGAGCHLAMVAGNRGRPKALSGHSMLQQIDYESDDDDLTLDYSAASFDGSSVGPSVTPSFVWKKDRRTNKWYKKPVAGTSINALSEEERMIEQVKEQSMKDAMANSFAELQDVLGIREEACRHW